MSDPQKNTDLAAVRSALWARLEGARGRDYWQLFEEIRDELGYDGDYSFEVFNDDYAQMPLALVAQRAKRSVEWITDHVSRRSLPVRRQVT